MPEPRPRRGSTASFVLVFVGDTGFAVPDPHSNASARARSLSTEDTGLELSCRRAETSPVGYAPDNPVGHGELRVSFTQEWPLWNGRYLCAARVGRRSPKVWVREASVMITA